MRFLIPSYRRAGTMTTYRALRMLGVSRFDIVIGVQTDEDELEYRKAYPRAVIHNEAATCCAGNRQHLIDVLRPGERAVMFDDDVTGFMRWDGARWRKVVDPHEFWTMARRGFELAGDDVWGPAMTANWAVSYRERYGEFRKGDIMSGACFGFTNDGGVRFDDSLPFFDDTETMAHFLLDLGRQTYKLNDWLACLNVPINSGKATVPDCGGCSTEYTEAGERGQMEVAREIISRFPGGMEFSGQRFDVPDMRLTRKARKELRSR